MLYEVITLAVLLFNNSNAKEFNTIEEQVTYGKWVNYSDGYIPQATINPDSVKDWSEIKTVKRYKTIQFKTTVTHGVEHNTFVMDTVKQRYSGTWKVVDGKVEMSFFTKPVVHYSKNLDPDASNYEYATTPDTVYLPIRYMEFKNGQMYEVGSEVSYKHMSNATQGLINFYEFTGFANATRGNLIMILVALLFIYLAIRYDYEPVITSYSIHYTKLYDIG